LGEQEGRKSFGELFLVYYCCKRIKVIKRESYLKLLPIYLSTFLRYLSDLYNVTITIKTSQCMYMSLRE
jgi:hypothetical protein